MTQQSVILDQNVPDFQAEATGGRFSLSDYRGKILVIYFYPRDNTPGCTQQGIDFRDRYDDFIKAGAAIVGVSRDSMRSHEGFIQKYDFPFPLVSDTDESVCELFGVMKTKKNYGKLVRGIERSTFLIDPNGKLIAEWRGLRVEGHVEEVLQAVKKIAGQG
ncbi:MAG: peroxiredoxin [Alistipes senegalensis]|nr:peroxiredoxin [Oxalobacter formigenes]MCM1280990.1 peroxiredoxin [Alistipes senegalensis]